MKRWMILALTVFAIAAVFIGCSHQLPPQQTPRPVAAEEAASEQFDLGSDIMQAELWIDETYKTPQSKEEATQKLTAIRKSSLTDAEKSAKIRKTFPKAFRESLIFQPPLSWEIHSIALGYDIKSSVQAKVESRDVLTELRKSRETGTRGGDTTVTKTTDAGFSVIGDISGEFGTKVRSKTEVPFSFNPFDWFKTKSKLETETDAEIRARAKLMGKYSYGKKNVDENREGWSRSQQTTFEREHRHIKELLTQTTITNRHLSFYVTFTNHSREQMTCDLRNVYIPIRAGDIVRGDAKPCNPGIIPLDPGKSLNARFRMDLDNTAALQLVDFMGSKAPDFDIDKGTLRITSASYSDAINASLRDVDTRPIALRIPGMTVDWKIRTHRVASVYETTLRDALVAADRDFFNGAGHHLCKWGNNRELSTLCAEFPLGRFSSKDREKRFWVFVRYGNQIGSVLTAEDLDSPIPPSGCTLWVVDLSKIEDYKDAPVILQEAIFARVKDEAEKGDVLSQFRVALMLANGFGTTQNLPEAVEWYRRAAAKELPEAQFALGVCYGTGKGVKQDLKEAAEWFRKAAAKGLPEAQFALGVCYETGKGVEKNLKEAAEWYRKAAKSGDKRAAEALQRLQRTKDTSPVSSPSSSGVEPRPQREVSIPPHIPARRPQDGKHLFSGGGDTSINLVQQSDFKPVMMHGKPSAAFGWYFFDGPRYRYIRDENRYLSGEKCFKLTFDKNNTLTLTWSDPLEAAYTNPKYMKTPIYLATRVAWPYPPAPQYRITARVKFDKGEMTVAGAKIRPGNDWQKIDITSRVPFDRFGITPVAGASYSFASVRCIPVYPRIGGAINLPDGGKLTRFLLPENADYMTCWGIALWRGWLWKLTGVALPIETVKEVRPVPGAFAFVKGKAAPGGWHLMISEDGIVLTGNDERVLSPALFDYLRVGLGCAFYAPDCIKVLMDGSVKTLPVIDRETKPKFAALLGDDHWVCVSGGTYSSTFISGNDCDYYHLPNPQRDHILNVIMPVEKYFAKHPEYYMQSRDGKRVKTENPYHINPCFSNEEAMRLMVDNLIDYAQGQSLAKYLQFSPSDSSTLCLCEKCLKFNGGNKSNTDAMIEYVNRLMPRLSKVRSDLTFYRDIYASHHSLPTHVKPATTRNVVYGYALGHDVLPCTLHVDCEINRRCLNELGEWAGLAGGPQNLGFTTYRDIRPIHHLKQMEYLNRFGKNSLNIFLWKGYSPATAFVTARWNLGEDPEMLLEEFDLWYYGKGGKYVHEINLLVEKFSDNYKHTPEELNFKGIRHLCIWGGDLKSKTLLDRRTFDQIYALFDKALDAAGSDRRVRRHILCEKKFYLAEDLIRYNLASCKNQQDRAEFAERLAELIRCARLEPNTFSNIVSGVSGRDFVTAVSGGKIPDTGKFWANEPEVDKFLSDPSSLF